MVSKQYLGAGVVGWPDQQQIILSQPAMAQAELGNVPGHEINPLVMVLSNIDKAVTLVLFPWGYWQKE